MTVAPRFGSRRTEERAGDGRGDLASGNHVQEGDGETRLEMAVPNCSLHSRWRIKMWLHVREVALIALLTGSPGLAVAADDWQAQVGAALGKTGAMAPGGIYRVGLPRTDLKVTLDGVELKPGFALGSWLAFEKMGDQGMVMGDLVLTMDEVAPVMTKLAAGGIEVTALHNQLLRNQPFTMYMHVQGNGDPVKLAAVLHAALAESKTPLTAAPAAPTPPTAIDLDTAALDQTLGAKGTNNGGVYQFG